MNHKFLLMSLASMALFTAPLAQGSCGAAFCAVNTDWNAQGVWADRGARFDLHTEYIKQDQLRLGKVQVGVGQIERDHDEIETVNKNAIASFDYNISTDWGVSLTLPFVQRHHEHIGQPNGIREIWDFNKVGDARLIGRYQLRSFGGSGSGSDGEETRQSAKIGTIFGLKLPTGTHSITNNSGELAERTLQPGTGTTDLILGVYYRYGVRDSDASWFTQITTQSAVNERDNFKPGNRLNIDTGYRYQATPDLSLILQVNYAVRGRDRGSQAEPLDSGSRVVSLSPGLSYVISELVQIYTFVQTPLYQNLNGVQLSNKWSAVLGISTRF